MTIDWTAVGAIATVVYGVAFLASLGLVFIQLRRGAEERFVVSTQPLFEVWVDDEFQRAFQWVLYDLKEERWKDFVAVHRGDYGERAFTIVGAYFNRVGYLVAYHLLGKSDRILLDTVAGPAIAVWNKVGVLVEEARLIENSTLFLDYERMLPQCYECYVPTQPVPVEITIGAEEMARLAEG